MKERPILMKSEMVNSTLEGTKGQTRRIVNRLSGFGRITEFGQSDTPGYDWTFRNRRMLWNDIRDPRLMSCCPYGQPGDRLWVRENFWVFPDSWSNDRGPQAIQYSADEGNDAPDYGGVQKPSIHMPRWASRILLDVTDVRVQRVQEISEEDAKAEGVEALLCEHEKDAKATGYREYFRLLWDSINAKRGHGWETNPWVWAISFRRIKP